MTLRLLGGRYAVPPISYMGSKRGYAGAILGALGLRSGVGADRVILNDAGPWAHVWSVLADPANCAEVATILRGWADENPRTLWERLRAEHRGEWDGWSADGAAGFLLSGAWAYRQGYPESGFAKDRAYPCEATGTHHGGDGLPPEQIARRVESVAAWLHLGQLSAREGDPGSGLAVRKTKRRERTDTDNGGNPRTPITIANRLSPFPAPLSTHAGNASDVPIPDDCDGVYMLVDPPYHGEGGTEKITGYAHDLPRADLLALLRRWSDAGAVVCCCECVGLADDLGAGWHEVDITGARVGQRRTFSRQSTEVLTLNGEPAQVPARQIGLFG